MTNISEVQQTIDLYHHVTAFVRGTDNALTVANMIAEGRTDEYFSREVGHNGNWYRLFEWDTSCVNVVNVDHVSKGLKEFVAGGQRLHGVAFVWSENRFERMI